MYSPHRQLGTGENQSHLDGTALYNDTSGLRGCQGVFRSGRSVGLVSSLHPVSRHQTNRKFGYDLGTCLSREDSQTYFSTRAANAADWSHDLPDIHTKNGLLHTNQSDKPYGHGKEFSHG